MPPTTYLLDEDDVTVLRETLAIIRRLRIAPQRARIDLIGHQAPEVYVARIPSGGIAGNMGFEFCPIYKLMDVDSIPTLVEAGFSHKVHNPSSGALLGGQQVVVARDKFGTWYTGCCASEGVSGSGSGEPTVLSPCCPNALPAVLTLTIRSTSCPCIDGSYVLTHNGLSGNQSQWVTEWRDCGTEGNKIRWRWMCNEADPGFARLKMDCDRHEDNTDWTDSDNYIFCEQCPSCGPPVNFAYRGMDADNTAPAFLSICCPSGSTYDADVTE